MATHRIWTDTIRMIEDRTSHRQPAKIILDSNILLLSQKFKIDIFEELKTILNKRFELVLLSPIQQELLTLAEKGSPKMRMNASFALELTRKCKLVKLDECFESPDDAIVETAQEWKCAVFTNDRQLKKRLRNINVPVIYVRQKSRLEIDGRL